MSDTPEPLPSPAEASPPQSDAVKHAEDNDSSQAPATPSSQTVATDLLPSATDPTETDHTAEVGQSESTAEASAQAASSAPPASEPPAAQINPAIGPVKRDGPLSLAKIRELRKSQQKGPALRAAPIPASSTPPVKSKANAKKPNKAAAADEEASKRSPLSSVIETPAPGPAPKIEVPSVRRPLSREMEEELNAALSGSDLDKLLVGDAALQVGRVIDEGQRIQAVVMKAQGEHVFVSLGGADEGTVPMLQFEEPPAIGAQIEVIVRGYLPEEGLYEVTIPGNAVDVSDWSDLNEGEVIEAVVTGSNTGGLECKVGSIDGFIPASQASEFRIENLADLVGQKLLCVVTEANPRRGNLVLSHRAVLEREKAEKREERLAALEVGAAVDGVVRKITDFGAFVDIGGLDGLLHISQLSWDRVKHPSEVVEEGQNIQVRVDKIDKQSGKIGLSYRALQENPWSDIDSQFPVGSIVKGTVTRIAEFGAFVKIATGVEGLVHLSELAHHRVHAVGNVVTEGEEVQVKVLAIDAEQQRISLSIKGAQAAPAAEKDEAAQKEEEPRPEPVLPKHRGPLKGGVGKSTGGDQFGLKW